MKYLIFIVCLCALSSCSGQKKNNELISVVNNGELKYALFNINDTFLFNNDKKLFFIKGYKVISNNEITLESGHEKEEYYYFAVSSFDENPEIDGKLYKTENFINPKLLNVIENDLNNNFEVYIEFLRIEDGEKKTNEVKLLIPYF